MDSRFRGNDGTESVSLSPSESTIPAHAARGPETSVTDDCHPLALRAREAMPSRTHSGRLSVAVRVIRICESRYSGDRIGPGDFTCKIDKHGAQMVAIPEQTCRAGAPGEQKCEDMLVGLLDVARRAGEHEVVAAIICGLPAARRDVVKSDRSHCDFPLAIGADRPVPVQQPLAGLVVRVAARGQRGFLRRGAIGAAARGSTRRSQR